MSTARPRRRRPGRRAPSRWSRRRRSWPPASPAAKSGHKQLAEIAPDLFSSQLIREAREHLVANFGDPLAGLQDKDPELGRLVAGVVARADTQEPASEPNLRMSFLQLEQRRIDRELRRASEAADRPRQDELASARQDVRREMDAVMGQMA